MSSFNDVTPSFAVAPQIAAETVDIAKREGFALVVNNRPDGEAPGAPQAAEIGAAAAAAGLGYAHIPITPGSFPEAAIDALEAARAAHPGPALAFCASGTRSIILWVMAEVRSGRMTAEDAIAAARGAGYDIAHLRSFIAGLAPG